MMINIINVLVLTAILCCILEMYLLSSKIQSQYELKLFNKLLIICKENNLPVIIKNQNEMNKAAGRFCFYSNNKGCYFVDKSEIHLSELFSYSPWVLAHEIGHYYAIKYFGDEKEYTANIIAKQLILKQLNIIEKHALKISIDCHFKN